MTTPDTLASLIAKYRAKSQDSDVPKPRAETYGYVADELEAALDALVVEQDALIEAAIEVGYQHGLNIHWNWKEDKRPTAESVRAGAELRGRGASEKP